LGLHLTGGGGNRDNRRKDNRKKHPIHTCFLRFDPFVPCSISAADGFSHCSDSSRTDICRDARRLKCSSPAMPEGLYRDVGALADFEEWKRENKLDSILDYLMSLLR